MTRATLDALRVHLQTAVVITPNHRQPINRP